MRGDIRVPCHVRYVHDSDRSHSRRWSANSQARVGRSCFQRIGRSHQVDSSVASRHVVAPRSDAFNFPARLYRHVRALDAGRVHRIGSDVSQVLFGAGLSNQKASDDGSSIARLRDPQRAARRRVRFGRHRHRRRSGRVQNARVRFNDNGLERLRRVRPRQTLQTSRRTKDQDSAFNYLLDNSSRVVGPQVDQRHECFLHFNQHTVTHHLLRHAVNSMDQASEA